MNMRTIVGFASFFMVAAAAFLWTTASEEHWSFIFAYLLPSFSIAVFVFVLSRENGLFPFFGPVIGSLIEPEVAEYRHKSNADRMIDFGMLAIMPFLFMLTAWLRKEAVVYPEATAEAYRLAAFWAITSLAPVPGFNIGGRIFEELHGPLRGINRTGIRLIGLCFIVTAVYFAALRDPALLVFGFTRFGSANTEYVSTPIATPANRGLVFTVKAALFTLLGIAFILYVQYLFA